MVLQIVFILTALLVLFSALMVVTTPNLVRSALWLIVALFGVAVMFVLLEAPFLAVAQVVIYIGAIAILFIFAVMLTRRVMTDAGPQTNANWWLPALVAWLIFGGLAWVLTQWEGGRVTTAALPEGVDQVKELGLALVSPQGFLVPFEVASVLLLAALIGAIFIAWDKN